MENERGEVVEAALGPVEGPALNAGLEEGDTFGCFDGFDGMALKEGFTVGCEVG